MALNARQKALMEEAALAWLSKQPVGGNNLTTIALATNTQVKNAFQTELDSIKTRAQQAQIDLVAARAAEDAALALRITDIDAILTELT